MHPVHARPEKDDGARVSCEIRAPHPRREREGEELALLVASQLSLEVTVVHADPPREEGPFIRSEEGC
jgi:hypothetical protein